MAQAYASVTFVLEPSLEKGDEDFGSNVDEADSPVIAAGTPVSLLEEGENDRHGALIMFKEFRADSISKYFSVAICASW